MRNKFWTVVFALCPGASQMYQGYMKRGLSLITLFMLNVFAACIFPLVAVFLAVIYMYNFFDALNLHSSLRAGIAVPDDYIVHLELFNDIALRRLTLNHKLAGWGLVALGVLGLYEAFLHGLIENLYWNDTGNAVLRVLYQFSNKLPALVVCIALVVLGLRLVRGPKAHQDDRRMPPVPGDEDEE